MRIVADKAIAFIKNWLKIPDRTPASQRKKHAIGGCKIVKELGAGGYGQVFLAENTQGHQIAIKVMLAEVAATAAKVKMFDRISSSRSQAQ